MRAKKILSAITSLALAASMGLCALACGEDNYVPPETEPDGFDLAVATPTNAQAYNVPQDYCRTYYEVFVRSFADGDDDGIGDLRGLINNLDYLNDGDDSTTTDLGINGIWMMPINSSPSYHKYDVSDYYNVDAEYGTLKDFEDLVKACDARGIWLQMDLVLNHTSDQHPWFLAAAADAQAGVLPQNSDAMKKYVIVKQAQKPGDSYYNVPGTTDYWFLSNFHTTSMPDVNLENTAVRDEIKNIVDTWLGRGVRSFRLDAVPWACADAVVYNDENAEFWTWFNNYCNTKGAQVFGKENDGISKYCYNVGEVLETGGSTIDKYYQTGMSNFNFSVASTYATNGFAGVALGGRRVTAAMLAYNLADTQASARQKDPDAILSNLLSNHDMDRLAGYFRYEPAKIKMAAGLYLLAPGNPYIYYGEEIGAAGVRAKNETDANRRLPFNWGDSTKGVVTVDPPDADFSGTQALGSWKDQTGDKDSILTYYRTAISLRNRFPEIGRGTMTAYAVDSAGKLAKAAEVVGGATSPAGALSSANALNDTVVAYSLEYKGKTVLVVHNTGDTDAAIDISGLGGGYKALGAAKSNGGRVTVYKDKLFISGGISAVIGK